MTTITTPRFDVPVGYVEVGGVRIPCMLTREFIRFLEGLVDRGGGATGTSTSELELMAFEDAGIEETKAVMAALSDAIYQVPVAVDRDMPPHDPGTSYMLMAELSALRARVEALEQGTTS